jgi:hypothetical protein
VAESRLLRNVAVVVLVAITCPAALFGGSMLGCVGRGFSSACALDAIAIAPVALLVAGVMAGILSRGWTGMALAFVGIILGMTAILVLSFGLGRPVPAEPISGTIATIWFTVPVAFGYAIARVGSRLVAPSS